ncbi:MAG: complex I NDUFA9 subunit family protein [Rhodospirillales bacterium]|nr:complex I NDUFA9 subunit family protein [Rhodospirillales bacterium]MBO6787852.1 complex I NDUFA9 subunit family protein [Rhodospirillales bacterium]
MASRSQRRIITVFGASGFIGRHLVRRLAKNGWTVRAACRDPEKAHYLRTMGDVGQVIPWGADVRDPKSVRVALEGAEAAVNLVGILYESGSSTFQAIHADAAKLIAETAAQLGITRFVQMSALGAGKNAAAEYARTKAMGEDAVKAALPSARIVRPSVVFGPEDNFFNTFAGICRISPFLPVFGAPTFPDVSIGGGKAFAIDFLGNGGPKFQPVYVGDVADAIVTCLDDDTTAGNTYELAGPSVYSFADLMRLVLKTTSRKRLLVPAPFWVLELKAFFLEKLPKPLLTTDQVKLMQTDNVASGTLPGLADLGVTATPAEAVLPTYLRRYRTPLAQARTTG